MTLAQTLRQLVCGVQRLKDGERGSTLIMAIAIMVLIGVVMLAVLSSMLQSFEQARARSDRAVGLAPADSAIATMLKALQTQSASEMSAYVMTRAALSASLDPTRPNDAVVDNTDASIPLAYRTVDRIYWDRDGDGQYANGGSGEISNFPADAQVAVRQEIYDTSGVATGEFGYWQIVRIELPSFSASGKRAMLYTYVRAWMSDKVGAAPSKARMIKVGFRPGRFADYQILTDSSLAFANGAQIDGPVHSNGFFGSPNDRADSSQCSTGGANDACLVYARAGAGSVTCSGSAFITTGARQARIDDSLRSACKYDEETGVFVNFVRARDSFEQIANDCGLSLSDSIVCLPPIAGDGVYRLKIERNRVEVRQFGSNTLLSTIPNDRFSAILVNDDVRVEGFGEGRITIAARHPGAEADAADITIVGNIGTWRDSSGAVSPSDTLGLLADGNVVVHLAHIDAAKNCDVTQVNAAMIAVTGGFTIDTKYTVPFSPGNTITCAATSKLLVEGSLAGHKSPTAYWSYDGGDTAGYLAREYRWDKRFRTNTPPYFPQTDRWQLMSWRDANMDCLTSRRTEATCS